MTIIDDLTAKCNRKRASEDEVARLAGMTPAEFDADTTAPDPLEARASQQQGRPQ